MTSRQQKALTALIRAPTVEAAARAAGVGYSTVRKWLKDDVEFKAAYTAEMDALLQDASRRARAATGATVDTLTNIMQDAETPAAAKVSAAKTLIDSTLRLAEIVDTEARLATLEETMRGGNDI